MKNWPWYLWVVFAALVLLIGGLIGYVFYIYHSIGYLEYYLIALALIVGVLYKLNKKLSP